MDTMRNATNNMQLIAKKIVMGRDIGIHGNLFGGTLMAWIDEGAASFATEYCCTPNMVTVKVDQFLFKRPLKAGNHVRLYAQVTRLGHTSITLAVEARKFDLYSGNETSICTTSITFVRIDDDGTPTPIGESVRRRHGTSALVPQELLVPQASC